MDQQQEDDLGYEEQTSPLHARRVQFDEFVDENGHLSDSRIEVTSSYGDSYSGSDSFYEDSLTSWEDGRIPTAPTPKPKKKKVASRQQKRVSQARIFVLVLLALTAVGISLIVYFVTRNTEKQDYRSHYDVLAAQIIESAHDNARTIFTAMNTISDSMATRVLDDSHEDWPLVTFENFGALAKEALNATRATQIVLVPLFNETRREAWEEYSVEHQGWFSGIDGAIGGGERSLFIDSSERQFFRPSHASKDSPSKYISQKYHRQQRDATIPGKIHPSHPPEELFLSTEKILYAPVWQMEPLPASLEIVNYDLYEEPSFETLAKRVQDTRQSTISEHLHHELTNIFLEQAQAQVLDQLPTSLLLQPIWKTYDKESDLVGFILTWIPWSAFLTDAFRKIRDETIFVRIESSCQSQYSVNFAVRGGNDVEYLGEGVENVHPDIDESMERVMSVPLQPSDLLLDASTVEDLPQRRLRLLQEQNPSNISKAKCDIRMHFYPTNELHSEYITRYPRLYVMGVILAFVVLAIAFLVYDALVERRQYRVMDMAENTSRVLASLFPTQFADKLLAEKKEKEKEAKEERRAERKKEKKKKRNKEFKIKRNRNKQLKRFLKKKKKKSKLPSKPATDRLGYEDPDVDDSPLFLAKSKPMADLFSDTTVLFSDIAGFTAWSSVREPSQVFILLESIYSAFDFLAKQYGIFKIETIGDCYVAVCGLPEPREDHAVAMSRFAMACMTKMKTLVSQLEITLGPDTGDLTMRFGLHSGPVTAGVLRGERARFQLFGDTVNTAARMESTGERDKIQISQETSNKLIEAGKTHWFEKREGLVEAKGKGQLQTYWLVTSHGNQRRMSMAGVERRMTMGGPGGGRRMSMGGGRRMSVGGRRMSMAAPISQPNDYPNAPMEVNPSSVQQKGGERNIFAQLDSEHDESEPSDPSDHEGPPKLSLPTNLTKKQQRMVDWNCELLQQLLREVVARRNAVLRANGMSKRMQLPGSIREFPKLGNIAIMKINDAKSTNAMPLDEFADVINLPEFDVSAPPGSMDARSIILDPSVVLQLRIYVSHIAAKYNDNEFHNFEHASHVAMSVSKLLASIVRPDMPKNINGHGRNGEDSDSDSISDSDSGSDSDSDGDDSENNHKQALSHHTYGIASDPLAPFCIVLAALIHDVDHKGVPNDVLIKEEPELAAKYHGKSLAEQHSIDVAWDLLMHHTFNQLRDTICGTPAELKRFRQLIVQGVLSTDLFDPEMSSQRIARWEKAFKGEDGDQLDDCNPSGHKRISFLNVLGGANSTRYEINRRTTLVIENLMQAADVAHTMQHWHIYEKWNTCLFKENYAAFKKGRIDRDPSEGWYENELQFFDEYVIPLAKKLKECGVFGVSSDEYLNYATANRKEWEVKGKSVVDGMIRQCKIEQCKTN